MKLCLYEICHKMLLPLIADVDECAINGTNNCEQKCTNQNGGYFCSCSNGTILAADGISCNSKD